MAGVFDFNENLLPSNLGYIGDYRRSRNAFAKEQAERHAKEILNEYDIANNPLKLESNKMLNAFNKENYPLRNEEQRQLNEWRPRMNQSSLDTAAVNRESTGLANQFARSVNPLKLQEMQREAKFNAFNDPYARHAAEIKDKYAEQLLQADIRGKNANADWRSNGGAGGGVAQKAAQYAKNLVTNGRADLSPEQQREYYNSLLAGNAAGNTFNDGSPMPEPTNEELAAINDVNNKTGGGKALTNQAVQLQAAAEHIGEIPIDALKAFAGPQGKFKFAKEQANELAGGEVSNEYAEYKNYRDNIATLNMDALRKAYGTSVVPEYVFSTIGQLMNPSLNYLNSPAQVEKNVRALQDYVNKGAEKLGNAARFGLAAQNKGKNKESSSKKENTHWIVDEKGNWTKSNG
jgi:hypothetical protein